MWGGRSGTGECAKRCRLAPCGDSNRTRNSRCFKILAIIGSGPTATYALKHLTAEPGSLDILVLEAGAKAGPGMPYARAHNGPQMLANIASIEIPPLTRTLVEWLESQSDAQLARLEVERDAISERAFYPRIVLGAYFAAEFKALCAQARTLGHRVSVETGQRVLDIVPRIGGFELKLEDAQGVRWCHADGVIVATGHRHKASKGNQGPVYRSPYPTRALRLGRQHSAGIIGSSLSAIDAVIALAQRHGSFETEGRRLVYRPKGEPIALTMLSRKGLLPEADFYYPIPEAPLEIFSDDAVLELVQHGKTGLLARAVALFKRQLMADDPGFLATLGLKRLTPEGFCRAYFEMRGQQEALVHAKANLAEAKRNHRKRHTVKWRYTLMRAHEVFSTLVPYLNTPDLQRFHKTLKPVFADAYGCVPHASIARLLALADAGCLGVVALSNRKVVRKGSGFGLKRTELAFETLIDARGQQAMTVSELGFKRLAEAMLDADPYRKNRHSRAHNDYRLPLKPRLSRNIFCLALPAMLKRYPFAQGLVSSDHFGHAVAQSLLAAHAETARPLVVAG